MRINLRKEQEIENVETDRRKRFYGLSGEEKMKELCYLIELSMLLSGEGTLKKPDGRGIIIKR